MSLSKESTIAELKRNFIVGYRNIKDEKYAGNSGVHPLDGAAVGTTNGAGPHNVQMFILSADGTVLHCLPGYWQSDDLNCELELAKRLNAVWLDKAMKLSDKKQLFVRLHKEHAQAHGDELRARSQLQGFDAMHIYEHRHELADCISDKEAIKAVQDPHKGVPIEAFKTTDQIMHSRLAEQPFVAYKSFNVEKFADYGCQYYDREERKLAENPYDHAYRKRSLRELTASHDPLPKPQIRTEKAAPLSLKQEYIKAISGQNWRLALQISEKLIFENRQRPQAQPFEMRALACLKLNMKSEAANSARRAIYLGAKGQGVRLVLNKAQSNCI